MTTEIILRKDVDGLGEEGDIKKVAGGYARNYLFPFGYAVIKTDSNIKKLENERGAIDERKAKKLNESKSLVDRINGVEIELHVNAAKSGKLFGSITALDIVKALDEKGHQIDKKQISLPKSIKSTGIYDIPVKFYGNISTSIKAKIVDKEQEEQAKQEEQARKALQEQEEKAKEGKAKKEESQEEAPQEEAPQEETK